MSKKNIICCGCVDNIDELRKLVINSSSPMYNVYIAEDTNKYNNKDFNGALEFCNIDIISSSLLLHPDFYKDNKDKIEEIFYKKGRFDNQDAFIDVLKTVNSNKEERTRYIHNIIIDKFHYDEKFLELIAGISKNKVMLNIQFIGVRPSDEVLEMFRNNMTCVSYCCREGFGREVSNDWITTNYLFDLKEGGFLYNTIPYHKLINSLDNLDYLLDLDTIRISNMSDVKPSYRTEINSVYLPSVVEICKDIRERGYDKPIVVYCDSLNDVSGILSFADTNGIRFCSMMEKGFPLIGSKGGYIETCRNNNLYFKLETRDYLDGDNDISLYDKLKLIYLILINSFEDKSKKNFVIDEIFGYAYDLCKYFGLTPIKSCNPGCLYLFEEHKSETIKFDLRFIDSYFEVNEVDLEDEDAVDKNFYEAIELSSENTVEELKVYEKYINANSIDEVKNLFIDSVNTNYSEAYISELDQYKNELGYLKSILMDISEDDYLDFRDIFYEITSVEQIMEAVEFIGRKLMEFKKSQIGIVLTQFKK